MKSQVYHYLRIWRGVVYALVFFQVVAIDAKINGREYAQNWGVTFIPTFLNVPYMFFYFARFGRDIAAYFHEKRRRWYLHPYLWAFLSLGWFVSLAIAQLHFAKEYLNATDQHQKPTLNLVPVYLFIPTLGIARQVQILTKIRRLAQEITKGVYSDTRPMMKADDSELADQLEELS